jgi:iron complex transport system substrate-binding protein
MNRAFILFFVLIGAGCGSSGPVSTSAPQPGYPMTFTDSLGRSITLPKRPQRIVSLSPAATETLFAVGAGARVVAVTDLDNYPPEARSLPRVGNFTPSTFSAETLFSHKPDLVLTISSGRFHQSLVESLAGLGMPMVDLEADTVEQVIENVRRVGTIVGEPERGATLAAEMEARVEAVRRRTARLAPERRPRVFYVVADEPLMTAGPSSFLGQVLRLAGGENLFADTSQLFPLVSDEVVIRRDPDLILGPAGKDSEGARARLRARPGWGRMKAVREGRITFINEDILSRPGPRLIDGLEEVARTLHPVSP